MSTLATAVQNRIATARLAQLTRPNDDTASTVDTTYLEYAVTDCSAEFATHAGVAFDATDDRHIALGVAGVMALLRLWKGQSDADEKSMQAWRDRVKDYAKTTSRARIPFSTTGERTPTAAPVGADGVARPTFDRSRFRDLDVDQPPAGTSASPSPLDDEP